MRKLQLVVISVPLLLVSTVSADPASAQQRIAGPVRGGRAVLGPVYYGPSPVRSHMEQVRDSIRDGRRNGELTRGEARRLRREARIIEAAGSRYARDGLSDSEARELESRSLYLSGLVNAQRAADIDRAGDRRR